MHEGSQGVLLMERNSNDDFNPYLIPSIKSKKKINILTMYHSKEFKLNYVFNFDSFFQYHIIIISNLYYLYSKFSNSCVPYEFQKNMPILNSKSVSWNGHRFHLVKSMYITNEETGQLPAKMEA